MAWKAYDLLTGDEESVSLCQRSPRLCLALCCMLPYTAGWINWIKLDGCLNEMENFKRLVLHLVHDRFPKRH